MSGEQVVPVAGDETEFVWQPAWWVLLVHGITGQGFRFRFCVHDDRVDVRVNARRGQVSMSIATKTESPNDHR